MKNGFNPGVLLDLNGQALAAHARGGLRRVINIDGVDAETRHEARALDLFGTIDAPGRHDLNDGGKGASRDQRAETRALGERRGRGFSSGSGSRAGDFNARLLIERTDSGAHGAD